MGQADRTLTVLGSLSKADRDPRPIVDLLAPGRVTVVLGDTVAVERQAQLVFSLVVNLLGRLYPVVQSLEVVVPTTIPITARLPRWGAGSPAEHARNLLAAVNPPLRWSVVEAIGRGAAECAVIVGDGRPPATTSVFVGADGWSATISPRDPVPVGGRVNPVGAYAAACLAVGEVCKRLLEPHRALFDGVPIISFDAPLTFSTFTYRTGPGELNPALPDSVDLHRLTVVGLGAGGGAVAFTLASLDKLAGLFRLIEPDEIVESNLNRYVYAGAEDARARRAKASVVVDLFHVFPNVVVRSHVRPYADVAPSLVSDDYRYVVAAVHSREARRTLQFETPMVLWDAGATEHAEFFVWRMILGRTECMHCKHPTDQADPERDKAVQLTRLLGLDVSAWLRKVRDNEAFAREEIAAMGVHAARSGVSVDLPTPGQRYGDWEIGQCGRLPLPEIDEEIPFPCAPVMAGVLLAGEIIKEHYFPDAVLDSYYWNTLLGRFMARDRPYRRNPRPDCSFCHDDAYLAQYRHRWMRD